MTRWMQPPLPEQPGERRPFDPLVEGARHGLPSELLLAIWERVRADASDSAGRYSEGTARQLFHELATLIAARGAGPGIAKRTRVGVELDGDALAGGELDLRDDRVPGRETLVLVEARRQAAGNR